MGRIVIISDEGSFRTFATDDPKLEVFGLRLLKDGVSWGAYRFEPVIDRVSPSYLNRLIGNAEKVGHFDDMACLFGKASPKRVKPKAKTRNAKKRRAHSAT